MDTFNRERNSSRDAEPDMGQTLGAGNACPAACVDLQSQATGQASRS